MKNSTAAKIAAAALIVPTIIAGAATAAAPSDFEAVFSSLSVGEKEIICSGVENDPHGMYDSFAEGFGAGAPSYKEFIADANSVC